MASVPLPSPRTDPVSRVALARLPETEPRLHASIAEWLVAMAEAGRVRCPKVAILVDWAKEIAT